MMTSDLPPLGPDGLRQWRVAAGILVDERGILLVLNQRRNGRTDWSTPGGVIDSGEGPEEALTREVREETGLVVHGWSAPVYRVDVIAPDMGFHLEVEARQAVAFSGQVTVDDPDGIVIETAFVSAAEAEELVTSAPRWVSEPLVAHLQGTADGRTFSYRVGGAEGEGGGRTVTRVEHREA